MARVTVEDCITVIPNRFELVLAAAQRGRQISAGAALTVDRDNDKNPVVALREIADETVDPLVLKESVVYGLQKRVEIDEPEDEDLDLSGGDRDLRPDVAAADMEDGLLAEGLSLHENPDGDDFDLDAEDSQASSDCDPDDDDGEDLDEMDEIDIANED